MADALREALVRERGIGEVVEPAALVEPGPLGVVGHEDPLDGTVQLGHVGLEPGQVEVRVAPGEPGRVVDDKGRRVGAQLLIVQWQSGQPVTVFPPDVAVATPFWPKR